MTTDVPRSGAVQVVTAQDQESEALEAMVAHHRELDDQVARRVAAVAGEVERGGQWEVAVADLVAYAAGEVLPHARAEELTLYRAAAERTDLAATVAAMTVEHGTLAGEIDALVRSTDGPAAAAKATDVADLFSAHVRSENELILPALAADVDVSLAQLLRSMQHEIGELRAAERGGTGTGGDPGDQTAGAAGTASRAAANPGSDPAAALLGLLLEATTDLARSGRGDRACRLAAAAWSALRDPEPALAARVGPALHRLARIASSEPVAFRPRSEHGGDAGDPELDVRSLVPAARHETIFAAFDALAPGEGFVLVNDHDPRPLRYQLEAEHPGTFTWSYEVAGPTEWRVRIARTAAVAAG